MGIRISVMLWMVCMVTLVPIYSQVDTLPPPRTNKLKQLQQRESVMVDSSRLLTYSLQNVNKKDSFHLKGLEKYFQQYDPARERDFDYATLGNVGSAAFPMALQIAPRRNFSLGYDQYKLYQKDISSVLHFDLIRPISELYFSGGETQSDLRVGALFSRSFTNDVNWVMDYDRISQQGIYDNQAVKQTSFLTSLSWKNSERLTTFFTYVINSSVESTNGGVVDLSTLNDPGNIIRENVNVFSSDAGMRLQNQHLAFNGFYALKGDSTSSDFKNSIQYQAQIFNEFFRFSDGSVSVSEASLYDNFLVSDRGLRNYNENFRVRNAFFINSSFKDVYHIKTGLTHDYNTVDISGLEDRFHEIYLNFDGGIQLKKRLKLDFEFYYGLLDVANEFSLDAIAKLNLTNSQGFNFGFNASRYGVNFIQETAAINQEVFYDLEITPIILQTLKAEYFNSNLNLKLGGQLQNTFNYVYFDTSSLPTQDPGLYSISLLYGKFDFQLWKLLLENVAYLQNQNKQHVNLPSIFTKNSLSYYGKIFKGKMLLKAGLDFRYIVSEHLPYYNPVIGQFYLNEDVEYKPYPMLDARISFKVSSLSAFVKYENLTSFLIDDIEQTIQNYPQFDARFRFGFLWNLRN